MSTQNNLFQGAEINGKQFPFVRVTVAKQHEILKKFRPKLRDAFSQRFRPETNNSRMWKKVRSLAFVKDWKWKYFFIVPKELRLSQISLKLSGEIQANFFDYVAAEVKGHDAPLNSLNPSRTETSPTS